jgi:diguanylate cyclase
MTGSAERGLSFARGEAVLSRLHGIGLSAEPRNYEVWYGLDCGIESTLGRAILHELEQGTLTQDVVDRLYSEYQKASAERVGVVQARALDQIDHIATVLKSAEGSTTAYGEALSDIHSQIGDDVERETMRSLIGTLLRATQEMEAANRELEHRLSESRSEILHLQNALDEIRAASLTDQLTGLANRKAFEAELQRALAHARATRSGFALLMIDIDHFKRFNDRFGHLTGDYVLKLVAHTMKMMVGERNIAARFGGEEFAIILPETPLQRALELGEQLRQTLMVRKLVRRSTAEDLGQITISVGAAVLRANDSLSQLIERADACLYAAKAAGRNRVVSEVDVAQDPTPAVA